MKKTTWFWIIAMIASIFVLLTLSSCEKEDVPSVTTLEVMSITYTSAVSGGTVTDNGGLAIAEKGICWGLNPDPGLTDSVIVRNNNVASYGCDIVGLTPNTTYYVRAYATNAKGTGFGASVSFTTLSLSIPELTTAEVTDIIGSSASSGGNITSDGGASVTARGICWAVSENPTLESNAGSTNDGEGTGEFTSRLSGLDSFTTYYVRAYAKNSEGTAYGNQNSFTTGQADGLIGTVTDVEGNVYPTVYIGGREWMTKNLRTRKYQNGDPILTDLNYEQWQTTYAGAYDVYPYNKIDGLNSEEEVLETYGALYNWFAASSDYGVCPTGWHVPLYDEWYVMIEYIVEEYNLSIYYGDINGVGNALKSCRQVGSPLGEECSTQQHPRWNYHFTHYGFDQLGFGALPGGIKNLWYGFTEIGCKGEFWTLTGYYYDNSNSYSFYIRYTYSDLVESNSSKRSYMSIRCIKD